jgi:hypothetical protein
MNHTTLVIIIFISFWLGCKKDNQTETPLLPPDSICDTPSLEDMTGAKLWGDGTPASCTQAKLQQLINDGGKIKFNGGDNPFTLTLSSSLIVPNKEVIIDGANKLTISGNNAVRIFDIQPTSDQAHGTLFSIRNMNLANGKAPLKTDERGGAAIYGRVFGSLKVINVNFENNTGPLSASDDCGAVHTIMYKEVLFANCNFRNNKGANGGAVGTIGSAMTFINCVFDSNNATGTGGTFSKGGSGGAIYVDGTDQNGVNNFITICGCKFLNNTSGYQSGAVNIIFYENKGSVATINKCTFDQNNCTIDKGGACYFMNGSFSITNSTFSGNNCPAQGGAIWGTNINTNIVNCTFWENKAVKGADGLGGAVTLGNGSSKIVNCTFAENQAGNFASAIFNGGSMSITNNLFYKNLVGTGYQSNPYGGAVINKGTALTVNGGNLQYPKDFTGQYGTMQDYWITTNVLTVDALLQSLANNGGPTKTMLLLPNSPAIGKGTSTGAPLTDQRGYTRKNLPDIGAFETQP